MKQRILNSILSAGLMAGAAAAHADIIFVAQMTHDQEVIAGGIPDEGSKGYAVFVLNDAQTRLTYDVQLFGLDLGKVAANGLTPVPPAAPVPADQRDDVYRMHIHAAPAGVNGGIQFGMIDGSVNLLNDPNDLQIDALGLHITGAWDLGEGNGNVPRLAANINTLLNGGLYINVHTADHAGGEIRGQILRVPEPGVLALLGLGGFGLACVGRRRSAS